jgi:hypothetical protein
MEVPARNAPAPARILLVILRPKALENAQAATRVPSTVKCSRLNKILTWGWLRIATRKPAATSPASSRSRFAGERGRMPHRIIDPQPHVPAEQQVAVQLLHQQPLRADRIEGLEQERPQQCSGGIDGRPRCEDSAANAPDSPRNASLTIVRIGRSG